MATVEGAHGGPEAGARHHQRTKSSVLRSFIGHKRNNSDGSALPSSATTPANLYTANQESSPSIMGLPEMGRQPRALGELQQNQQGQGQPRSPRKHREDGSRSPQKSTFATISLRSLAVREATKVTKPKDTSPVKPKKTKSATNLTGLLSRPKSNKNLKHLATEQELRQAKDKENRTPPSSMANEGPLPPIFAQFTTQAQEGQYSSPSSPFDTVMDPFGPPSAGALSDNGSLGPGLNKKPRPWSFQPYAAKQETYQDDSDSKRGTSSRTPSRQTWGKGGATTAARPNVLNAFQGMGGRTNSQTSTTSEPLIDPKDVDKHLEAMLDRRNIPENQRYKMRNLNDTIKMEFIRQDWAETQAKNEPPSATTDSDTSMEMAQGAAGSDHEDSKKKKKHTRGRSLTLGKGGNKDKDKAPRSPSKSDKARGTLGRHFRTKSTDSVASTDRPSSAEATNQGASTASTSTSNGGIFAKVKGKEGPSDFVQYLRKVQKPELVEVGKLHKLRLLLRNETVSWTEDFIKQGGMQEIVGLLYRILKVEWREEHEDALLHENLLCLKALCTTALALQYLHSIQSVLLPALIHMIFDPDKKGPSEFTTRNIITSVLLTYIECATPQERVARAETVLHYLRDPEPKEEERPVSFVLEMRRDRPYRVWCKEVVSVTKEVFWIFLHNLNVVALPADSKPSASNGHGESPAASAAPLATSTSPTGSSNDPAGLFAYMARHFPQERPPVPAAPYVGGVEWDATNYLASHLDLMNAILACTGPTSAHRNALRAELRISGFERCLGGSLRLCKEKFYAAVHDALRVWVAAAHADGWDVRDVRFGPPPETRSRSASPAKARSAALGAEGGDKKKRGGDKPPQLEMPKLDFQKASGGIGSRSNEPWLS